MRLPRIRPEQRAPVVSVLLAAGGLLAVVGSSTATINRWFTAALIVATIALVVNLLPETRELPRAERQRLKKYRDSLAPLTEWAPGVLPIVGGTLLMIVGKQTQIPGFLCEVHGPEGVYFGMTPDARASAEADNDGFSAMMNLPTPSSHAGLVFPREFSDTEGRPPHPSYALARGTYVALWFGFETDKWGGVRYVYLTGVEFTHGLAGLERKKEGETAEP